MPTEPQSPKAERLNLDGFIRRFHDAHLKMPQRSYCWILGAGCSVTSGISAGAKLAASWLEELYEDERQPSESKKAYFANLPQLLQGIGWPVTGFDPAKPAAHYSEIYAYRFRGDHSEGCARIEQEMKDKDPAFGYTVLARFLAETRHRVVITTNFDNLVTDAVAIHTNETPLICAHENLAEEVSLQQPHPLILKVHRDVLLHPMSAAQDLEELHRNWERILSAIFATFTPIVIGYDGNDGTLMTFLRKHPAFKNGFYWCHRRDSQLSDEIHEVVRYHQGRLVEIEGFDELLCRLGAPLRLAEPVTDMDSRYQRRKEKFKDQLKKYHVQLTARPILVAAPETPAPDVLQAIETTVQETKDASDWWEWDQKACAEKDPTKRDAIYQQGIQACPRSHELHTNYAIFLHAIRQDPDRAEALYCQALELAPNQANITGNYANFLKNVRNDPDRAEALYRKALELDPNQASITGNYANFLTGVRKDHDRAEALYRKALELDPSNAANTGNYATFLKNIRKDQAGAEALYRKALELDPNHALNTGNYASFLKEIHKDHVGAEALYRKALELDPNDANNTGNYAECLLEQKKWQAGEEQLQRAWKLAWPGAKQILPGLAYVRVLSLWGKAGGGAVPDMANLRQSLGWLKHLLTQGVRIPTWSFDSLLAALSPGWPEERVRFPQALADVVNDKAPLTTLDAFPEWRATPPVAPTPAW